MKTESGSEVLNQIIQNWWIVREKLQRLCFNEPIVIQTEEEFLQVKGLIARKLQPLIQKEGNPQEIRDVMMRFLRRLPNLQQLQQLSDKELKSLEKECHNIYLRLNRWSGEINLN